MFGALTVSSMVCWFCHRLGPALPTSRAAASVARAWYSILNLSTLVPGGVGCLSQHHVIWLSRCASWCKARKGPTVISFIQCLLPTSIWSLDSGVCYSWRSVFFCEILSGYFTDFVQHVRDPSVLMSLAELANCERFFLCLTHERSVVSCISALLIT
jgi:hypothetical protein